MSIEEGNGQIGTTKWLANTMLNRLKNSGVKSGDQVALDNLARSATNPKDEEALKVIAEIRQIIETDSANK